MPSSKSNQNSRRRQINPAFAAAHGLVNKNAERNDSRLDAIVKKARKTGKVLASNADLLNLQYILDLRTPVDFSLETSCREQFIAETLLSVDVSDNSELDWDETLLKCGALKTFRARNCHFQSWYADDNSFRHLDILDLSNNLIKKFDLAILPRTIRDLDLSSNQIECLFTESSEKEIEIDLPNLQHLNLEENQLIKIPPNLKVTLLQKLRCGKNNLSELLLLKQELPHLTALDASNNSIETLPPSLEHLSSLTSFRMGFNRLSRLPRLPTTVVLAILNDNCISTLQPPNVTGHEIVFPNASCLLLRNNRLTNLDPFVVEQWVHLETLDVYGNSISTLPYQLGFLPQLKKLLLDGNPLRNIRSAVSDLKDTQAILKLLRKRAPEHYRSDCGGKNSDKLGSYLVSSSTLSMENKGLEELSGQLLDEVKMMSDKASSIKNLHLPQNKLTFVHEEWFTSLPNLTKVNLDKNQIQIVSLSSIMNLKYLTELRLSHNRLEDSIFEECNAAILESLQVFDMSCNLLKKFPRKFLSRVPNLRTLNLSENQIASGLEECTSLPSSLEMLDLSNNQLLQLGIFPLSLAALCHGLRILLLNNNNIESIPLQLGLLPSSLKTFDLRGNPQYAINYAVLSRPVPDLLKFMKNRMTTEELARAQQKVQEIMSSRNTTAEKCKEMSIDGSDNTLHDFKKTHTLADKEPQEIIVAKEKADPRMVNSGQGSSNKDSVPESETVASSNKSTDTSVLMTELQQSIDSILEQLKDNSLSTAKRFAVKKQLAMERSKLIRERRRLEKENKVV